MHLRRLTVLCTLALVGMCATARANDVPHKDGHAVIAQGETKTKVRNFPSAGVKATVRVKQTTLPAGDHGGREVETYEGKNVLVRRTTTDGPVTDGTFVRTVRTTSIQQTPEAKKAGEPQPWARKPGDFEPRWSARNIEALYSSKPLGAIYDASDVKVRLFAPYAKKVELVLDSGERFRAVPDRSGVWEAATGRAAAALYGKGYHLEVDGQKVTDPYAAATGGDYGPAKFVNLGAYKWNDKDYKHAPEADVISEVHVRDMTASPTAPVADKLRGSYGGMAAKAIVDHFKELGVGTMEPLPLHQYDHASGDRGTMNHWGYMTTQFFSPVRRYALNQDNAPEELMGMVDKYHQNGMSVAMDVVFNHTATGPEIAFNVLGRSYYYRLKDNGELANGAGTGNEFASERPMARKLIIDSLRHFVDNYHIDGFRFDLGALLDVKTMRSISKTLPPHIFLTSEPWSAEWDRSKWSKGDLGGTLSDTNWSVWNDDYRNAVNDFITGNVSQDGRNRLMTAVAGSAKPYGFSLRPQQVVNYIESHDELATIDRVNGDKGRALIGTGWLLMSRGRPMLAHGQEFLRTKKGIANAHNLDNDVSHIDWSLKEKNRDAFDFTKRLIALRKEAPQINGTSEIKWLFPDHDDGKSSLGAFYPAAAAKAGQKRAPDVVALSNTGHEDRWFKLPADGTWQIVVDGTREGKDADGKTTATGYYRLRPGSFAVLTQTR
jgi:pullulanase